MTDGPEGRDRPAAKPGPRLTLANVETRLGETLSALPGLDAQVRMAPRPRPGWNPRAPDSARIAAALLLLYERDGRVRIPFTVRHGALAHHAGQVSLPGGVVEPDETIETAAIREAHEEIGVSPAAVRLVGRLTPLHIPVSGFSLHPVIATTLEAPRFVPAHGEVEEIFELAVEDLLVGSTLGRETRTRDDAAFEVPFFGHGPHKMWGATAMVLAEFLWLLGWRMDPWA